MPKKNRSRKLVVKKTKKPIKAQEVTRLGSVLRSLGGLGGSALGSIIGMGSQGGTLGTDLGAMLSRWLGSGDYTVTSNSLVAQMKSSGSIPMMHSNSSSIVVRHKEYICDITGSVAFAVNQTFPLNPALPGSYPWLSAVAGNFQEYSWRGLVYHYVPTSGDIISGTNPAIGSVMIATNYRATAPAYVSKQFMLNEAYSSDAKPSVPFCHPIECDPKENPYNVQYTRAGPVPSGEDQKTYDIGTLSVATQGMPAANIVGELWCTYEVELRKPIAGGLLLADAAWTYILRGGTVNTTNPLGTTTSGTVASPFAFSVSATTLTFPPNTTGNFIVLLAYVGAPTALGSITPAITPSSSTAALIAFPAASTMTAASGTFVYEIAVTIVDSTVQTAVSFSGTFVVGTLAAMAITVVEANTLLAV